MRTPIVVVIDGLDEAEGWKPTPELFPPLPPGIGVVFSAREVAGRDWLDEVGLRAATVQRVRLATLSRVEIGEIVRAAGDGVPVWVRAPEALEEMHRTSGGDPLYVRYLVDDLLPDADGLVRIGSLEQLASQPSGLTRYFDNWWTELEEARRVSPDTGPAVRDLLCYLLVSKGPLSRDDLSYLSDEDALDDWLVDDAVAAVGRHIRGDADSGYELAHPRFQAYLVDNRLKEQMLVTYRDRLVAYCARWPETQSRYALLHYADHLADAARADELLALARDEAFTVAQGTVCPDEPRLPARVCGLAFAAAAGRDDAAGMTEAALRKAAALAAARTAFSPLAAVRDIGLEAAWSLADLQDPQRRALWQLVFVWELHATGRDAEAAATLDRLLAGDLAELTEDAVWRPLFRPAGEVDAAVAAELETRLLTAPTRALVASEAAAAHARAGDGAADDGFAAALAIADQIANPADRGVVRASVAKEQLSAGDRDGARESYGTAVGEIAKAGGWLNMMVAMALLGQQAEGGDAAGALASAKRIVAVAKPEDATELENQFELQFRHLVAAEAGAVETAISVAEQVPDEDDRAEALLAVGKTLAAAEDTAGAARAYMRAGDAVGTIQDESVRAKLLAAAAAGQAAVGDAAAAQQTYVAALAASREDESDGPEPEVATALIEALAAIGGALAQSGDRGAAQESYKAARESALAVVDAEARARSLVGIAEAQARAGDPAGARETTRTAVTAAQAIASDDKRVMALVELGAMQAEGGDLASASETYGAALAAAQRLTDRAERTKALATLAFAQAATDESAARETYAAAIWDAPIAIRSDAWRVDALARLAEAQAKVGGGAARETALAIGDDVKRRTVLAAIAGSEADAGDVAAALATVSAIPDGPARADTLATIARAQARAGDVAGARRTADEIEDESRGVYALVAVAQAQAEAGDTAGSRVSAALAFESARAADQPRLIAAAACELARAGDVDASRAAARLIGDKAKAGAGRKGFLGWVASLFITGSGPWLEALSDSRNRPSGRGRRRRCTRELPRGRSNRARAPERHREARRTDHPRRGAGGFARLRGRP